jgi:hypothetical protein
MYTNDICLTTTLQTKSTRMIAHLDEFDVLTPLMVPPGYEAVTPTTCTSGTLVGARKPVDEPPTRQYQRRVDDSSPPPPRRGLLGQTVVVPLTNATRPGIVMSCVE